MTTTPQFIVSYVVEKWNSGVISTLNYTRIFNLGQQDTFAVFLMRLAQEKGIAEISVKRCIVIDE